MESTQIKLRLQEELEANTEAIISAIEGIKSECLSLILDNEFDAAKSLIERLKGISNSLPDE